MQTEFSMLLRTARKEAGLTQKKLASMLGVATGTVQQWELGVRFPRVEMLKNIEDTLEIALVPQRIEEEKQEKVIGTLISEIERYKTDPDFRESFDIAEEMLDSWQQCFTDPTYIDFSNPIYIDILSQFNLLNPAGQEEAVKRVHELTRLEEYQRTDLVEQAETATEPLPEDEQGKSSTTQEKPPEGQKSPNDGK